MGWKEYKEKQGITHDFGEFGCKEFWVKLRRLDSFPYGETRKTEGMTGEDLERVRNDPKLAEESRDKMERDLGECVLDWNLTDPMVQEDVGVSDEERCAVLPIPSKDDVTSFTKLPTEFIVAMLDWVEKDSKLAKRASKATGTSSTQR